MIRKDAHKTNNSMKVALFADMHAGKLSVDSFLRARVEFWVLTVRASAN
jgi:hypothetical protein